jgi:hypothetical protein
MSPDDPPFRLPARKLLVTGCGRSGTKYIALVLRRLGLDVQHEAMGRDGVVSWYMAVDAEGVPFGPARQDCEFEHVLHQVRHPLAVIASAASFKPQTWEFICAHIPVSMVDPLPLRCAKYWYYWNLEAERVAHWRYRVEDLTSVFETLCARLRVRGDTAVLERVPTDLNTRARGRVFHYWQEMLYRLHLEQQQSLLPRCARPQLKGPSAPVLWADLASLDADLAAKIRAKAVQYGYIQ